MAKYSFEEFKLIYESAERVTDRRIAMNKVNYSIATATFVAIAFLIKFTFESVFFVTVGCIVILVISIIAFLFTIHWLKQINDFKLLNTAKFNVINEMSNNLSFDSSDSEVKSFRPFVVEWDELKKQYAIQAKNERPEEVLKSSKLEKFMPIAFQILYIISFVSALIVLILSVQGYLDSFFLVEQSKICK